MKIVIFLSLVFGVLLSCNKGIEIQPQFLIGKWKPSYHVFNESTKQWEALKVYMLLPDIEFTSDGKFLINGRPGAEGDCCGSIGNKFSISGNTIVFSEFNPPCPNALCLSTDCKDWIIKRLASDTLELRQCPNAIYRYTREK